MARLQMNHPRYRLYELLFEKWFKEWGLRLNGIPTETLLEIVDTYDAIWANSEFTREWIGRYWDRPSRVLPPPVEVESFKPRDKKQRILSVGRFFAGSHNKKHLAMIAAFKHMVDRGLDGWELHLAGGTTLGEAHQDYLNQVYAESEGYPIWIHTDVPFPDLVTLYGESTIYWHASGFGENETQEPVKFEHFGITTVEAMSSGCVPVVIGRGGQREIVNHGQNGFLWHNLRELRELTWTLIRNPVLRRRMSEAAIERSREYDRSHFYARLDELLDKVRPDK